MTEQQIAAMVEALRFYANPENHNTTTMNDEIDEWGHVAMDNGDRARAALALLEPKSAAPSKPVYNDWDVADKLREALAAPLHGEALRQAISTVSYLSWSGVEGEPVRCDLHVGAVTGIRGDYWAEGSSAFSAIAGAFEKLTMRWKALALDAWQEKEDPRFASRPKSLAVRRIIGVRAPCDGFQCLPCQRDSLADVMVARSDGLLSWLCWACAKERFPEHAETVAKMEMEPPF